MNNRKSQKGVIDTNNRPLSKKSDARIQQKPQQRQQQLHHQPKAHGGDDDTPSGGSARQTHYKFEVAPPNPFGAKSTQSDHAVRSNMESDGNRQPPKTTDARKCSSPKEEELECIRNTIKDAYEKFIGRKKNRLYRPTTVIDDLNFYITKLIGCLSIIDCQHEKRRTNRSNGTNREPNDGIPQISKEIKKLFNSMRDGTLDVKMKDVFRNEPDSAEDMLKCIEWSFRHYQQEFEWYRQEKKNVEIEIEKLAKDVCDTDAGTKKGIHEQISCIRLQIKQQKREYLTSVSMYEKEMSCVEEEVNKLVNEVNCINEVEVINKQCKLETKEDNEFRTVKIIRQIRRSLESQNCQTQERLRELENKSQYNRQVLGDLCSLLNMDLEPRQKEGSCIENSDLESIDKWKVIVENMKRLVKDRGQFVDHARTLLKDISTLISREPFSLTMSGHSDTKLVQVLTPDFQQLVYDMNNVKLCLEEYRKSHKEKFLKIEAWNELKECEKKLQKEIEELKEEKDVLLNRLSKMAGANLTDNNPAIADLSDPNRATKLAEQFSELYDNSWTDAYEVLEISDENECIQYLLNIIVESYNMCSDISKMQQRALARALHNPTEGLSIKTIANEVNHDSDVNLSKLQSRTLSDLRKTSVDLSIVDVKSYITAKNENWVRKGELKQFTMSCIELCWFMHLQSPPVYLDATLVSGSTLDTNKYKPYTKSGKKIDFIVWPSLYLHKDGPILCKGVAQGK
ncbi:repetitive organellar protein-like isoform X2 [Ruditapes philippinarum]|uniref:repetitive organellar protein-like isoform X2 n=1 Tax=Ruditapes philippinarum TaxID=129788 RepID=UPI00295B320F|nr:repetitive organellar protein-like isoform X2 [Ruditapes philippinarum]